MVRTLLAAVLVAASAIAATFGCGQSAPPPAGDRVVIDTHPTATTTNPPPPPTDAGVRDAYADAYRPGAPDGYAPLAACQKCGCGGDAGTYCFGGGTNQTFNGTCVEVEGGAVEVGCNPIPAACRANPDCACILEAMGTLPCYPVCTITAGAFSVYCPVP